MVMGLLQIAHQKVAEMTFIEKEIRKILEDTDGGHTSDAIFSGSPVDTSTLYSRLQIKVVANRAGRPKGVKNKK